MARLSYQYDVFPLTTWNSWCLYCPPILKLSILKVPMFHEYRLYREGHSWSHFFLTCFRITIVVHEWCHMEMVSDSMTTKFFIDKVTMALSVVTNQITYL